MNDFFLKCNICIHSELDFKKYSMLIKLPFYFHIKDISNTFYVDEVENEIEFYGKEIYFQNERDKTIEEYKSYLRYVDLKQFTIDDCGGNEELESMTVPYRGARIFKNVDCLYDFLTNSLGFTEVDYRLMKMFIFENQHKIASKFITMINEELEINSKSEDPSEVFMILRCAYELNHSATVFPENQHKSISEYSFRELRVQRAYLGRKCELEKIQYDKVMKSNKK